MPCVKRRRLVVVRLVEESRVREDGAVYESSAGDGHPASSRCNDTCVRQRERQCETGDDHEAGHEVAKVQEAAVVVGGEVIGAGAASTETVG